MTVGPPPRRVYRGKAAPRRCVDCHARVAPGRRYCGRDRERRRALTFLLAAREHTEAFGDESINGELDALMGRLAVKP